MSLFAQLLVNGIIAGSLYALVASGFSLIYATNKFMHFAHGASVVVSAYILYTLFSLWKLPFFVAVILTIVLSAALGWLMYRLVYLPLVRKKASNVILLIASIGLLILFENISQLIFGADVKSVGLLTVQQGVNIGGAAVTPLQIVIVLTMCGYKVIVKFANGSLFSGFIEKFR